MVWRKKKIEEQPNEKELPPMPVPSKFAEKYGGGVSDIQPKQQQAKANPWRVIQRELPPRYESRLVNDITGEEFEINSLEDVAELLNSLEK